VKRSRLTLPFLGLIALLAAPFAMELAAPGAIPPRALLWIGGPGKLLLLALGAGLAWRNIAAFERGTRARSGWLLLFAGLVLVCLGQAGLVASQLLHNEAVFFPSPSDVLFLLSYPAFIAALLKFLRAYAESGYPIGDPAGRRALAGITALLGAAIAAAVLRPVLLSGAPAAEKALNTAYTLFDFALLIPTVLLLRITLRFPGGAVWRIWMAILGGFLAVCAGDILFAYSTAMAMTRLDPLVDLAYILGYGCLALGMAYQRELLA
jgi:uncharacterized membrane protein